MLKVKEAIEMFKDTKCEDTIFIPINDLLTNLKAYEVQNEEVLELANMIETSGDNSYNWYSPLSHDVDYQFYEDEENDKYYMELQIHMGGDIRGNYTESMWFVDDYSIEGFLRLFDEVMKTIYVDYNGYTIMADYTVMDECGATYVTIEKDDEVITDGIYVYVSNSDLKKAKEELIQTLLEKGLLV